MLGIHKFCISQNDPAKALHFIEIRDGFCYATNRHIALKVPAAEVFGQGVFKDEETLYIRGEEFRRQKFDKAKSFTREGNRLKALNRNGDLMGESVLNTPDEFKAVSRLKFPRVDDVLPAPDEWVAYFGVHTESLKNIADCFGGAAHLKIKLVSAASGIYTVEPLGIHTQAQIVVSGSRCDDEGATAQIRGLSGNSENQAEEIRALKKQIAEEQAEKQALQEQIDKLPKTVTGATPETDDLKKQLEELQELKNEAAEKGHLEEYEGFYFSCPDEQKRILFQEFIDRMKEMAPMDLLGRLQAV